MIFDQNCSTNMDENLVALGVHFITCSFAQELGQVTEAQDRNGDVIRKALTKAKVYCKVTRHKWLDFELHLVDGGR